VEPEDDEDGDEVVGCGLEIRGQGLTPRPSDKTVGLLFLVHQLYLQNRCYTAFRAWFFFKGGFGGFTEFIWVR